MRGCGGATFDLAAENRNYQRVSLAIKIKTLDLEKKDVPLVFTRVPGESNRRRLNSLLLYLCYVFRARVNSLVC